MGNRPFFAPGLVGVVLIITSLFLTSVFPKYLPSAPIEYGSPIIAFEFVKSQKEVHTLFHMEDQALRQQSLDSMDLGNKIDFAFAIIYSLFLGLISYTMFRQTDDQWFVLGIGLAVLACITDILENIQLLQITSNIDIADFGRHVALLQWFTWLKWISISLVFVIYSKFLFNGSILLKIISALSIITLGLGIVAFFIPGRSRGYLLYVFLYFLYYCSLFVLFISKLKVELG